MPEPVDLRKKILTYKLSGVANDLIRHEYKAVKTFYFNRDTKVCSTKKQKKSNNEKQRWVKFVKGDKFLDYNNNEVNMHESTKIAEQQGFIKYIKSELWT